MKRRHKPTAWQTFRVWIWPRRSWLRSGRYVTKRILRLTATPHAVSAGVAVGAFTSFTPFMGFHFIVAAVLAWLVRGNIIASALGTFFGNPLTFPFIWAGTYKLGTALLGMKGGKASEGLSVALEKVGSAAMSLDFARLGEIIDALLYPVLLPMLVGGCILGTLVAVPIYFAVRRTAILFREARQDLLMRKAIELRDRARAGAPKTNLNEA